MELNIPNTTNTIDGHFSDLKNKLRNHNGLSRTRKIKFFDEFLVITSGKQQIQRKLIVQ